MKKDFYEKTCTILKPEERFSYFKNVSLEEIRHMIIDDRVKELLKTKMMFLSGLRFAFRIYTKWV